MITVEAKVIILTNETITTDEYLRSRLTFDLSPKGN